ncbi:uridine kinase family protein [Alterisphingorhabdus coralli]|uniref:Phosphoribulokinase/uridine kinase domain-containing protein n=1 Tax=Alterisphingorhabdus coralli TaxID=3071408 RepID=A0AA97FAC2_9SPHN|nr:hypothetical protein [Parasphingorhabdus sp. SCSIO 66989]WOE75415.1 hypothetical protein RB602_01485 [Parasphingorhabdus sp. SCSIO 66989]
MFWTVPQRLRLASKHVYVRLVARLLKDRIASIIDGLRKLNQQNGEPVLLAIDGRSGSGKTSIAAMMASQLPCTIIPGDDFYAGGVKLHSHPPETLADICIDRERLRAVLKRLKSGQWASYAAFDWEAFDGRLATRKTVVEPQPFLIVEGVYSYHPDLRDMVDLAVLIEVPEKERMHRLLAREGELTDWERQWHRAEDWYFAELSPHKCFDTVLRNVDS